MAAWTKDTTSEAPRVVFTPPSGGSNHMPAGLERLVYDPEAPPERRWTAELSAMYQPDETLANVEAALAGDFSWQVVE